jgi:molybdopterin converting factor small subunit
MMDGQVRVALYGAFRQSMGCPEVLVRTAADATVADLRRELAEHLPNDIVRGLLRVSAFATDEQVLQDTDPVPDDQVLAVLPPVCGG